MSPRILFRRWGEDGGGRELLLLAWPLIISNSFWTLQITIDRVLLTWYGNDEVAASLAAAMFFWTPLTLLQQTAGYATTFVAQYLGAGRPHRVGPVVWQALYFSGIAGVAFLGLMPLAGPFCELVGHDHPLPQLEAEYLRCLCYSALPTILVGAVSGFFTGRGDSRTVMLITGVGMAVNAGLDYLLIFGHWGFPRLGIAGAGWATVAGNVVSALLGLVLLFRPRFEAAYRMLSGWRFDGPLFRRLLWFGVPNGLQWSLETLAFSVFIILVGQLGKTELAATSIAVTINIMCILPTLGIGQAVGVLVGQRLGQERPEVAERSTWTGFWMAWSYMTAVAALFVLWPGLFVDLFASEGDPLAWAEVAKVVPVLLQFVALYSLFDSVNLVFSFALRGAGDTRFVTLVSQAVAWPVMVLPTWVICFNKGELSWCWAAASAYVIGLALVMLFRFRSGIWKTMRVIEPVVIQDEEPTGEEPEALPEPSSLG